MCELETLVEHKVLQSVKTSKPLVSFNVKLKYKVTNTKSVYKVNNFPYVILVTADTRAMSNYLTAITNSEVIQYWIKLKTKTTSGKVDIDVLINQIPIPEPTAEQFIAINTLMEYHNYITNRMDLINSPISNRGIANQFNTVINAVIYELFFPYEFKTYNLTFAKWVVQNFTPVALNFRLRDGNDRIILQSLHILQSTDSHISNGLLLMNTKLKELINIVRNEDI